MPSSDGWPVLPANAHRVSIDLAVMAQQSGENRELTMAERNALADGEPYCFRCGKPASSFEIYRELDEGRFDPVAYAKEEEGTYNPDTNRFACDACYIAIGMPSGPDGWRAP